MAATSTMTHEDALTSQYLSNSLSSLSASRSQTSTITKTYRQATSLYLTRRLKEALETLEPIITVDTSVQGAREALIAEASRGTRVKVWVFYLSLINAIIELGSEQGKLIFGSTGWRQIAAKARGGTIWQDIIDSGYGGSDGDVDGEVVVNLTTLLLSHMPTQQLNQSCIESYLSSSTVGGLADSHVSFITDGDLNPNPANAGASSPKELATRLKILELYTLYILPRNEEWAYAQEFIEASDTLDEERREAFLHALQSLKDEKEGTAEREKVLKEQQERELNEAEDRRIEEARTAADERSRQVEAEAARSKASSAKATISASPKSASNVPRAAAPHNSKPSLSPSRSTKKPPTPSPPPTLYRRASSAVIHLHQAIQQAARNMTGSSMALTRLVMFLAAFLLFVGRRDLRLKIKRALRDGFNKVRQTVGMGVKVSYI